MQLTNQDFLIVFLGAFFLTSLSTPLMRILALRMGITDKPNQSHKTHAMPIPYLGGVAIIIGVLGVTLGASIFSNATSQNLELALTILTPALLMGIIGLVDDIKQLKPWPRFISQNIIGLFATSVLISTDTLGSPTGILALDFIVTIVWIVGVTNSINFFDNIDGGASGTIAISSLAIFTIAFSNNQFLIAAMSLVLTGSTIGFLIWNKPPARIYMGDAGALFLGILVASLSIRLDTESQVGSWGILVPIFLLAVPILDTSVAVVKRLWRKVSPFQGGRDHLSHRLMRMGLSKRNSVLILWTGSGLFSFIALGISNSVLLSRGIFVTLGVSLWILLFATFLTTADER